jgi:hypothetical protein
MSMPYRLDEIRNAIFNNKSIREFSDKIKNKNGVFLGYVCFLARERGGMKFGKPDTRQEGSSRLPC